MLANFDFIKSGRGRQPPESVRRLWQDGQQPFLPYLRQLLRQPFVSGTGIVRNNVPNTEIKMGRNLKANMGIDMALWRHRVQIKLGYYNTAPPMC